MKTKVALEILQILKQIMDDKGEKGYSEALEVAIKRLTENPKKTTEVNKSEYNASR